MPKVTREMSKFERIKAFITGFKDERAALNAQIEVMDAENLELKANIDALVALIEGDEEEE